MTTRGLRSSFSGALAMRQDSAVGLRIFATCAMAALLALTSASAALAQSASIVGVVLRDSSEAPLANAEVLLKSPNRSTRTDSAGSFTFRDLKPGRHSITVRLIGYESLGTDFQLKPGETVEPEFILRQSVTKLKAVDVKAAAAKGPWSTKLQEFEERRAMGVGRFLTADFFEKQEGAPMSSFLAREVPGLKFITNNGHRWMASTRGGVTDTRSAQSKTRELIPEGCYMQVVINGIVRFNAGENHPMFDVEELNSKNIIGFEFYTGATTPLQYNVGRVNAGCGTVIIWTK